MFRGLTSLPVHGIFTLATETGKIIAKDPSAIVKSNQSETTTTDGFHFEANFVKDPANNGDGYYLQYIRSSVVWKFDYELSISKGVPFSAASFRRAANTLDAPILRQSSL